jgi:hypothetical protein
MQGRPQPGGPLAWLVQLALPALAGRLREKGVSQRTWDLEALGSAVGRTEGRA